MPLSVKIQKRDEAESKRVYKIVIISLCVALWILAGGAVKVGADRVQPTYTEVYNGTN